MRFTNNIGAFEVDIYPGQPQVAHCHGFFVLPELRARGAAHDLKELQSEMLKALLIDYATCTVRTDNEAQKRVLVKAGWTKLASFFDRRQNTQVELWGYEV